MLTVLCLSLGALYAYVRRAYLRRSVQPTRKEECAYIAAIKATIERVPWRHPDICSRDPTGMFWTHAWNINGLRIEYVSRNWHNHKEYPYVELRILWHPKKDAPIGEITVTSFKERSGHCCLNIARKNIPGRVWEALLELQDTIQHSRHFKGHKKPPNVLAS